MAEDRFLRSERKGPGFTRLALQSIHRTIKEASARPNPNQMYLDGLRRLAEDHQKGRGPR